MSMKKGILIIGVICVVAVTGILYFRNSRIKISDEVVPHLEKLYSLSGELTPEQKQEYVDAMTFIETYNNQTPLPTAEAKRVAQHADELALSNPEIFLLADIINSNVAHGHPHGEHLTEEEKIKKKLDVIDASIAHFKKHIADGDISPENAENFLNFLETIRENTANPVMTELEYVQRLIEVQKTDPDIVGFKTNLFTREVTNVYPNMITIRMRRIHEPDGTFKEEYSGNFSNFSDEVIQQDVQAYVEKLSQLPPGEEPPPQPEHEGLRFQVVYKDIYPSDMIKQENVPSPQPIDEGQAKTDKEDMFPTTITNEETSDPFSPDIETDPRVEEADPRVDTDYAEQERFYRMLEALDNPELEIEILNFLESLANNENTIKSNDLERFFEEVFIPDKQARDKEAKDFLRNTIPKPKGFTPERFKKAVNTLQDKGMRDLEKTDPDMAEYLKKLFSIETPNAP